MRAYYLKTGILGIVIVMGVAADHMLAAEHRESLGPAGVTLTSSVAPSPTGRLLGMVTHDAGFPVETMLVSASGPAGTAVATCDADGRFEFPALRPGIYLLRAHASGFTAPDRHVVEIKSGLPTLHSMRLRRASTTTLAGSAVLTAGVASGLGPGVGSSWLGETSEFEQPFSAQPDGPASVSGLSPAPHDHTEKAWRLRRTRRSVLKDEAGAIQLAKTGDQFGPADQFAAVPGSPQSDLLNGFALSGQFQLLTRATIDSPARPWSVNQLPGQVAYVALGAPVGEHGWGVRGAVTAGDSGSWVLASSYATETSSDHSLELGVSYSKQRAPHDDLALTPHEVDTSDLYANREVGSIKADGVWTVSPRLSVGYGATVAHYGYLEDGRAFSPRAQVIVEPIAGTRVRAVVMRHMLAPGAEEFLPPTSGVWLPPERTFAPLLPSAPLQVERTRHLEVALERDVGSDSVIGVRRFYQDVTNQTITLFGVRPSVTQSVTDHYYLANARGLHAEGWGVSFSHALAGRVHGVVDYSVTRAQWAPWAVAGLTPQTVGVLRTGTERVHDVTTSVETEIPETATRVFVLARVNTAYSRVEAASIGSGLDARFAFRVQQTLPFAPFGGADWEVLVDVRNLFREQVAGASVYDELLVVSPPKQFVGGLIVHF